VASSSEHHRQRRRNLGCPGRWRASVVLAGPKAAGRQRRRAATLGATRRQREQVAVPTDLRRPADRHRHCRTMVEVNWAPASTHHSAARAAEACPKPLTLDSWVAVLPNLAAPHSRSVAAVRPSRPGRRPSRSGRLRPGPNQAGHPHSRAIPPRACLAHTAPAVCCSCRARWVAFPSQSVRSPALPPGTPASIRASAGETALGPCLDRVERVTVACRIADRQVFLERSLGHSACRSSQTASLSKRRWVALGPPPKLRRDRVGNAQAERPRSQPRVSRCQVYHPPAPPATTDSPKEQESPPSRYRAQSLPRRASRLYA
jgi:hypothetical protein